MHDAMDAASHLELQLKNLNVCLWHETAPTPIPAAGDDVSRGSNSAGQQSGNELQLLCPPEHPHMHGSASPGQSRLFNVLNNRE